MANKLYRYNTHSLTHSHMKIHKTCNFFFQYALLTHIRLFGTKKKKQQPKNVPSGLLFWDTLNYILNSQQPIEMNTKNSDNTQKLKSLS